MPGSQINTRSIQREPSLSRVRIAIIHWTRRRVGGAETYTEGLLPALALRGHSLGFWHESDGPTGQPLMSLPPDTTVWDAVARGTTRALEELRAWRPDVLFAQGVVDPHLEERLLDLGLPAVFFAHNYYGSCISGRKSFALPAHAACHRRFGAACLAYYYPRRCGGLSPLTMWRHYRAQGVRLALLRRYQAVVVASEHMAAEYARHEIAAGVAPLWGRTLPEPAPAPASERETVHLLFMGRLEAVKGGQLLLQALPAVARALRRPIACHFAGMGPARFDWERRAARLSARHPGLCIRFHGWLPPDRQGELLRQAHLLVVPSVWPEPFGLVGLEAAAYGVPAVAFAVGGIPQWLHDGTSGWLVPSGRMDAAALARTLEAALADPVEIRRRGLEAKQIAKSMTCAAHVARLETIFQTVLATRRAISNQS